jgi:hypothetical protein
MCEQTTGDVRIGEVAKSARERVRVSLTTYEGYALCDIRVYVQGDVAGVFDRPTRKGVSVRRDLLPTLRGLLQKAEREASRERALASPAEVERS